MKFNNSGQLVLVAAVSLLLAGLVTACGTLTTDFVFVASSVAAGSSNYGEINVYEVNSESGSMRQIPTSPFPSAGRDPVAEAVSSDYKSLFVVNRDDNTVVQFIIGSDGKLYPQSTTNTPGIFPMAVAVNGSNLFVVDTYQPLSTCSSAAPCAGSVAVLPLSTTNTPGTAVSNGSLNYWPLTLTGKSSSDVIVPTGVNVLASGNSLFISAYDTSVSPTVGYVFGYSVASGGVLAPLPGSPYVVGTQPSGLASDKAGANLYVTDYAKTSVYGFAISANGLTKLSGSPYLAGNQPSAVAVDPTNGDVFVTNAEDSTVTSYTAASGVLTVAGTFTVGTQPVAIGIDPSKNHFLYTANFLAGTVSAFEIPTTGGTLIDTQNSPYASNALPTAVAAVPHSTN